MNSTELYITEEGTVCNDAMETPLTCPYMTVEKDREVYCNEFCAVIATGTPKEVFGVNDGSIAFKNVVVCLYGGAFVVLGGYNHE